MHDGTTRNIKNWANRTSFKVSTIINQPIEIVIEALMNPDNFTYWTTDL